MKPHEMGLLKNIKLVQFLIVLYNFSVSQQQCIDYKNSDYDIYYPPDQIYLLESSYPEHRKINEKFISQNAGYLLVTDCQLKVEDIIEYSKRFPYLINLYVPDFYENNYNKVRESLVYAGDINGSETKVNVCKSANIREDGIYLCEFFIDAAAKKYVKLSTQMLEENYEEIFRNVLEFQPNKIANPRIQLNIIVCKTTTAHSYYKDGVEINYLKICNDVDPSFLKWVKQNTLAVLAPKVFNIIRPIDNPVVFFEDSYITKETKDWFKNSMTAVPWQSLKYGFLFFIKKMKWIRVAIISDSSEYSQKFEAVLTTLLRENGIAYMAETCVTSNCGKVINKINENGFKIIIANFDQENMEKIAPYAKSKKLVRARKVIWITRDLSMEKAKEAADMLNSEIFNISFKKNLVDILKVLFTIRSGIQVICDIEPCSFNKSEAAAQLRELLVKTSKIEITSVNNNHNVRIIGSIVIEDAKITYEDFNYSHPKEDSFNHCTFWNNSFEYPCNGETELVLLMMVLSVFFLTVLGVILFFQSPELEMSYRRMP